MFNKYPEIISGGLFSIAVIIFLFNANVELFLWLNQAGAVVGGEVWVLLTLFGNAVFALVFLFIFFWRCPDLLRAVLIAVLLAFLVTHGMKLLTGLERPYGVLEATSFHLLSDKLSNSTFPSGHAAAAFAIFGCISFYFRFNLFVWVIVFFASLVGLSRIMLGVHWPIDVLVGAALGWVFASFGVALIQSNFLRDHNIWNYITYTVYLLLSVYLFLKGGENIVTYWPIKVVAIVGGLVAMGAFVWMLRGGNKKPVSVTGWLS